jgi:hypothetical protein
MKGQWLSRGIASFFLQPGLLMTVGGQRDVLADLPPGITRYPLYRELGEPQGRYERVRKISPPPGLDPRTVWFRLGIRGHFSKSSCRISGPITPRIPWILNNFRILVIFSFVSKDAVNCGACAYYSVGDRWMNMRMANWCNDIEGEKLKNSEKAFPSDTVFISSPTRTVVRTNLSLRGERSAIYAWDMAGPEVFLISSSGHVKCDFVAFPHA